MSAFGTTPSQTIGPFFHVALARWNVADLAPPGVPGERVTLEGRIVDGDGLPVTDALVEIWQADAGGWFRGEGGFCGHGRTATDGDGRFRFSTIRPGRVPGPDGTLQAPHLAVSIFARGLLKRLVTRVYFPDQPANDDDPVLRLVPAARRATLVARAAAGDVRRLSWDVVLQGEDETVFFAC